MTTYVSITQRLLDGHMTVPEAATDILRIPHTPGVIGDDGLTYPGNPENTIDAILAMRRNDDGSMNEERKVIIHNLIHTLLKS